MWYDLGRSKGKWPLKKSFFQVTLDQVVSTSIQNTSTAQAEQLLWLIAWFSDATTCIRRPPVKVSTWARARTIPRVCSAVWPALSSATWACSAATSSFIISKRRLGLFASSPTPWFTELWPCAFAHSGKKPKKSTKTTLHS